MVDVKTLPKLKAHAIPDQELRVPSVRPVPADATVVKNLGLLANLIGSWKGTGFNLVARPDKEGQREPLSGAQPNHRDPQVRCDRAPHSEPAASA